MKPINNTNHSGNLKGRIMASANETIGIKIAIG